MRLARPHLCGVLRIVDASNNGLVYTQHPGENGTWDAYAVFLDLVTGERLVSTDDQGASCQAGAAVTAGGLHFTAVHASATCRTAAPPPTSEEVQLI